MLCEELMERLRPITEEEQQILKEALDVVLAAL